MTAGQQRKSDPAGSLLKAYSANARASQYLVEHLDPSIWRTRQPGAGGRTIAALVAHLHNCGLRYLERSAPGVPVPAELNRFRVTPAQAIRALGAKRKAVLKIVGGALSSGARIRGFPYDAAGFLAYYIAHDAHHRGQILMQARLLGCPLDRKVVEGLWQWGKRSKE